ncbi:MAG TPA: DUF58 domain-containing protein [Acidimicrobiales bacterium]|nr:DUF58 domain-containing protein [Acidimicrobiales bacterium]
MVSFRGLLLSTVAGVLAVVGLGFGVEEFVMIAIALGVLLVLGAGSVAWRSRSARRSLHLELRVPANEVSVGQPAIMELFVTNSGRRTIASVRIESPARHWTVSHPGLGTRHAGSDALRSAPSNGNPVVALSHILAWSVPLPELRRGASTTVRIAVPTATRGVLTLQPVGVWREDPFRLFARRAVEGPTAQMIACPVPDLTRAGRRPAQTVVSGRPSEPRPGAPPSPSVAGDDLSSLRPYVPGDHLNRLHWPALARTGDLVVRDFTAPEASRLALLVDLRPAAHGTASFEAAITRAATLGALALDDGVAVELLTSAGERLEIPPGLTGRHALMRALALLGPTNPPTSSALRWTGRTYGSAIWAAAGIGGEAMVLVTTDAGASTALPDILQRRASVEVVR